MRETTWREASAEPNEHQRDKAFDETFSAWFDALYARHTQQLSFQEIRRALSALSDLYVHQRQNLPQGRVFDGRGKRAAFALFYTPLHFLLVHHIAQELRAKPKGQILDLGCGTGAGAAAWHAYAASTSRVFGVDLNAWALTEARWNWRHLQIQGTTRQGDLSQVHVVGEAFEGILAAYLVNELADKTRDTLLESLLNRHRQFGSQILIVEPIAKKIAPWWPVWVDAFQACGGRTDTWHVRSTLPTQLKLLGQSAKLHHTALKGRSLYLPGQATSNV